MKKMKQVPWVGIWSLWKFFRCSAGLLQFSCSSMGHVIKGEGADTGQEGTREVHRAGQSRTVCEELALGNWHLISSKSFKRSRWWEPWSAATSRQYLSRNAASGKRGGGTCRQEQSSRG